MLRFFWFSGPAFHEGIETHELDGRSRSCSSITRWILAEFVLPIARAARHRRRKGLSLGLLSDRSGVTAHEYVGEVCAAPVRCPLAL